MKAVRIHAHGGTENLRYEQAPAPELTSGDDVIVQLKPASVNDSDTWIRAGLRRLAAPFPHILGSDGAGVVVAVGKRASQVQLGDAVCLYPGRGCGICEFCLTDQEFLCTELRLLGERDPGTYAEYVRVSGRNCFPVPAGFSFDEAAALPSIYLTLWRMLVVNARPNPGEFVLIRAASGGVTAAAIQIGLHLGARILAASTREQDQARAKELGAEYIVNSTGVDLVKEVRQITRKHGVDVAVDFTGDDWAASLAALARGGRLVTCASRPGVKVITDIRRVFWNHLKILGSTLGSRRDFRQVLGFVENAGIKPVLQALLPLRQAAEAQQSLADDKPFGKIVLQIEG